jgi:hypothetical protein
MLRPFGPSWPRWWKPTNAAWEEVGVPGINMQYSTRCRVDSHGEIHCEGLAILTRPNTAGLKLTIEHESSRDKRLVVKETVLLPFPRSVAGQKGRVRYAANWQALVPTARW